MFTVLSICIETTNSLETFTITGISIITIFRVGTADKYPYKKACFITYCNIIFLN